MFEILKILGKESWLSRNPPPSCSLLTFIGYIIDIKNAQNYLVKNKHLQNVLCKMKESSLLQKSWANDTSK